MQTEPSRRQVADRAFIGALLALAWLLGTAAAAFTNADPAATLAAASLLAALTFAYRPAASTIGWVVLASLLIVGGGWRYDATQPTADGTIAALNDGDDDVRLRGVVSDEPDQRATGRLYRIDVHEVQEGGEWSPASGKVLVRMPALPAYEYGDVIELRGELETPPEFPDFNYRDYLLREGVVSLMAYPETTLTGEDGGSWHKGALIDLRNDLTQRLDEALPEPQSSLAAGVLLGARSNLPADLRDDMRVTGTSHLIAVSGQNITILAGIVIAALAWAIGRRPAAWFSIAVIVGYALLVGAQPSVIRASIMAGIYVMSIIMGRQNAAPIGIVFAAALMTAHDPQIVHDIGFQLSFTATIGLVTLGNEMKLRAEAAVARWPRIAQAPVTSPLIEVLAISLAAIVFTLPITAVNFGEVSLIALPANLLTVPAFIAVAFTAALAIAGSVVPGGEVLAWLAWLPATYMIGVIDLMASVPFASFGIGGVGVWHAVAWYAVFGAITLVLIGRRVELPEVARAKPAKSRFGSTAAAGVVIASATVFVWAAVLTSSDEDRLSVTFLDVGQGDAALIEGPDGHRILVDGGPTGNAAAEALGRALPFYDRRIDLVVLTHPQADHGGGLIDILDTYDVAGVLDSAVGTDTAFALAWNDALAESGVTRSVAQRGMQVDLGGGAVLEVIAPASFELPPWADPNDGSTVLRVTLGDISFLLTGDIEAEAEAALVHSGTDLSATVLKVAHHGSRTSTTPAFVSRVSPEIGVISVGAENSFGHPAAEVLSRLQGDHVLRTDERGDIRIETDGARIWVDTQR